MAQLLLLDLALAHLPSLVDLFLQEMEVALLERVDNGLMQGREAFLLLAAVSACPDIRCQVRSLHLRAHHRHLAQWIQLLLALLSEHRAQLDESSRYPG